MLNYTFPNQQEHKPLHISQLKHFCCFTFKM